METDKTTLNDLVIFDREDEFSIFNKINFTLTSRGRDRLRKYLGSTLNSPAAIQEVQQTILAIHSAKENWPVIITNGTLMVVERFYEAQVDQIPTRPSAFSALAYKVLHSHDYSLIKYSIRHCFDFIKGMLQAVHSFCKDDSPAPLKIQLTEAKKILDRPELKIVIDTKKAGDLKPVQMLELAHFIRYKYRLNITELVNIFAGLDAWHSMSIAMEKYKLSMPVFTDSREPFIEAGGLYHLLLEEPVAYDLQLNRARNFLFLTGANMAGKSTFIKACGTAVYLAHAGMGVPAKSMRLSYFRGMLSNINVIDNIAKGESYFFNEVQRIKSTIERVSDGKTWLILIDELFKGTNVKDAMKCSSAVIEGLLKIKNAVFILSTHLYEIGEDLKKYPNISFSYFETSVKDDQLSFSYQLKDGISDDRLGYLILKKEGVVKMLEDL